MFSFPINIIVSSFILFATIKNKEVPVYTIITILIGRGDLQKATRLKESGGTSIVI